METLVKEKVKEKKVVKRYKKLPLDEHGKLIKNNYCLQSPRNLIITKFPKSGSTLSMADVPGILIGDAEGGTDDFKVANKVNLTTYTGEKEFIKTSKGYIYAGIFETVDELNNANNMRKYWDLKNEFDEARSSLDKKRSFENMLDHIKQMPFPIFCIDTITSIQAINNDTALYEYNMGVKKENRKANIKKADDYGGVKYIRTSFNILKDFIETNAAPFIIWSGHVANRKKIFKKADDEISAVDIALDGLYSNMFTASANAVAIFYRNDEGCFLDFTKKEESDLGSRTPNIGNRVIKIADIISDKDLKAYKRPKTYWSEIYPELFKN